MDKVEKEHSNVHLDLLHEETYKRTIFGFWLYLMTDCLLFGTLFCTYGVLYNQTAGGPSSNELFSLKIAFIETMILLLSSFSCGMALIATLKFQKAKILGWLMTTFVLGAAFIFLEITEFKDLIHEGHGPDRSAFLSSYFTLVGTHGLHVSFGLLWLAVMIWQVITFGVNIETFRRLVLFNMFWHFLDLVWIFLFTFVYLIGVN